MPQFGTGIVPASGPLANELTAITRRAFMPFVTVQLYSATPTLGLLLRNSQRAKGGMSQITAPVQGQSFVTAGWTDYSGSFAQPVVQNGITNAEFNLALSNVPIPFLGTEGLIQSSEAIVPLVKARLADAKTVMVQQLSSALFATGIPAATAMNGFAQAYDDGTNVPSYGGINRTVAANAFWKGQLVNGAGGILTRNAFIRYLMQATKVAGGESPDFAIMSYQDYVTLMQDFMNAEQLVTSPGSRYSKDTPVNAGFRALMLGDTPIFADPFCPKGTAYLGNSKYFGLYLSEDAPFAFSGFQSTLANYQIGYVGVVLTLLNTVCTKPSSGMQITGITGGAGF